MFEQDITLSPGTGTFTSHTLEIFIMLFVAFLMGLWLGWALWSRFRQMAEKLRLDNESLTLTANTLRGELDGMRAKMAASDAERADLSAQLDILERENADLRNRLVNLEEASSREHDRNRQLETELGLSLAPETTDHADIPLEITPPDEAGEPADGWATDPEAGLAGMAVEDATAAHELVEEYGDNRPAFLLEEELPPLADADPVVEEPPVLVVDAPPPAEVVPIAEEPTVVIMTPPSQRDDLKIVEGIGPKIEELLFQNGVYTYQQLAETPVEEIRNILSAAGSRFAMHDPGTWSAQALLAANGEWDNLKAYQDFLNAGKRPTG